MAIGAGGRIGRERSRRVHDCQYNAALCANLKAPAKDTRLVRASLRESCRVGNCGRLFLRGERMASVLFKGNPEPLEGELPQVGQPAPDFSLIANDLSTVSLQDSAGKVRIISVVPSVDT